MWDCRYYVIVAWIWAALFYLGLDPIKFAMMWISNEEGFRDRSLFFRKRRRVRQLPRSDTSPLMQYCSK